MVSIIIPVYNAEQTLRRCIDSILHQTYKDWELILIDDGSKDSSLSICNQYSQHDPRIKTFHKKNGGVSSARNTGLENALGDKIAFCDSDDYVDEEWLMLFAGATISKADIISVGYCMERPTATEKSEVRNSNNGITSELVKWFTSQKASAGYIGGKLFNASIIREYKIRFDESLGYMEDLLFISHYLCHAESAASIPAWPYHYVLPPEQKYNQVRNSYDIHRKVFSHLRAVCRNENDYCLLVNLLCGQFLVGTIDCFFELNKSTRKERVRFLQDEVVPYVGHSNIKRHSYWLYIKLNHTFKSQAFVLTWAFACIKKLHL